MDKLSDRIEAIEKRQQQTHEALWAILIIVNDLNKDINRRLQNCLNVAANR
ncbi:MAG: hypothetical protein V3T23_12450 [Nitrososphaerales archaeon]